MSDLMATSHVPVVLPFSHYVHLSVTSLTRWFSFLGEGGKEGCHDWEMLSFIRSLKGMVRSSGAVAVISFPPSLVSPAFLKRWQHLADTLISVKAIPDEDKELAKLLTGYQDMLGLLSVHKVARINTQVPAILEATTFSMKLRKRRALVLECLNQAPVDGSSGSSYGTSGSCSGSSKTGNLDF
ncbi:hypothetical protein H5410_054651 [Solanum commersonii]|uniref:Elongator complex protein 4 n=1 Tax=Solanum commersonii TaxID=4109 RepID=A0A9J5WGD7_SOLCO|nr:hypothetical protein H5410_054651 [Solanum commersonii]